MGKHVATMTIKHSEIFRSEGDCLRENSSLRFGQLLFTQIYCLIKVKIGLRLTNFIWLSKAEAQCGNRSRVI